MTRLKGRPPALWLAVLAVLGIVVALATAAPPAVTYRSNVGLSNPIPIPQAKDACQALTVLPKETRAVRLTAQKGAPVPTKATLQAAGGQPVALGPPVRVDGGRVMYRLPQEVRRTSLGPVLCLRATAANTQVVGSGTTATVDLLGAERGSWLQAIPLLSERASFARAIFGPASLPIAFLLLVIAWVLVVRTVPLGIETAIDGRAIRRVAAVALCMGSAYALTTPVMEAPDEMVHLHYVDVLRDRHEIPSSLVSGSMSAQNDEIVGSSKVGEIVFQGSHRPPWTKAEDQAFDDRMAKLPAHDARDVFTNASSQPPAYYALGAVVTSITGGDELSRLVVLRLMSALLMAFGVAGAVVFARAAVPSAGGLVLAGGLWLAALPLVGFIGGSVNPDSAYSAASAWALAAIAVMWRSGITMRRGLWLGAAVALGMASKLTFLPMLGVVGFATLVLLIREVRAGRGRALVRPVVAAGVLILAVGVPYYAWGKLSGRGIVLNPPGGAPAGPAGIRETLVYAVELYVGQFGPILDRIQGSGPHIFIDGFVGRLGWTDYSLSAGWNKLFEWLWIALAALAAFGVLRAIRRRPGSALIEAAFWVVAAVPLMIVIAHSGLMTRHAGGVGFEQARYLFPLASIGVAGVGLALRQLPVRTHAWAAAAIGTIAIVQATALWFVTIGRYFA